MTVALTWELLEGFAGSFLSPMYDDVQPTPQCHREWWEMYCSDVVQIGIAAPRGHAKSTALTHDFGLANVLFRVEPHVLIVSATEELSLGHLGDMAKELRDNDELREAFLIDKFLVDSKGEIIVRCKLQQGEIHPYEFRMIARGAGQKLRGLKWNGRRPGLILCDDMEEDEQVENTDRRAKFRKWVMRALLPLGRRGCKIRWHGTILHEDAMLARIMKDPTWVSRLYKAHEAFDDFSNILWPEMWSEERLVAVRNGFLAQGDPAGYSQEYLNDPFDNTEAYIRKEDLLPMDDEDRKQDKILAVGCDFAVSKKDRANKTSFTIGGKTADNFVHIIDQRAGRWDTLEWMEVMFNIQATHHPEYWFVEDGVIWKSMWPTLKKEMRERDTWMNFVATLPVKDKATRGRPYQKRSRSGAMKYDKEADWWGVYEGIILRFTGTSDAVQDDEFDSTALLVKGFDTVADVEIEDFEDDEYWEMKKADPRVVDGRSSVTGY